MALASLKLTYINLGKFYLLFSRNGGNIMTEEKVKYTPPQLNVFGNAMDITKGCDEELVNDSGAQSDTGTPGSCTASPS